MRWPVDHAASCDPGLAPWLDGANELCADARLGPVLRHLPGRRITMRVETPTGPAVLKVFARPRARGNHRRLEALGRSSASDGVPPTMGADTSGHVGLVGWTPGISLPDVHSGEFTECCRQAGTVLASLHGSGAELDRTWTVVDELALLERQATPQAAGLVELARRIAAPAVQAPLVSAHRDFHPRQIVVGARGVGMIDLDDAAMAPAALDVGNFIAHLRMDAAIGLRGDSHVRAAIQAFLDGYGPVEGSELWEWLSLVRLMCLATTRHGRDDWARALRRLAAARAPVLA
jgi:Ser/Thr protein kinase RdoA (MazF antagonist)